MICSFHGRQHQVNGLCAACIYLDKSSTTLANISAASKETCGDAFQAVVETASTPPVKKTRAKKDPKRHIKTVKVSNMQKQLRTILAREIDRLLDASFDKLLDRDQAVSLRGYIDLTNELAELDKIEALDKNEKKEK